MNPQNCWIRQLPNGREECLESQPEDVYGFTYLITNKLTGQIYVGKKAFTHRKKTALSKRARVGTRKRVAVKQVDSGWLRYWGSSKSLLEDIKKLGSENFERRVLSFAKGKSDLSYQELTWQLVYKVLLVPSYNGWISCKIYKNKL